MDNLSIHYHQNLGALDTDTGATYPAKVVIRGSDILINSSLPKREQARMKRYAKRKAAKAPTQPGQIHFLPLN